MGIYLCSKDVAKDSSEWLTGSTGKEFKNMTQTQNARFCKILNCSSVRLDTANAIISNILDTSTQG